VNTTLRFAKTNEVSTVSNSSITTSRIVNCNRSPNAIVVLDVPLHIRCLEEGKLNAFQKAIKRFISEHPRAWDKLLFVRRDEINPDEETVRCTIAVVHRNSWQEAGRILVQRGILLRFLHQAAVELEIEYSTPPIRRVLYSGGALEVGYPEKYKTDMYRPKNVRSNSAAGDRLLFTSFTSSKGDKDE